MVGLIISRKASKNLVFILTFFFSLITMRSRGQHSLEGCKKCGCRKWHQTISVDSLTKEKIIILSREKGSGCTHDSNCKTTTIDARCDYHYITSQYFQNGQLHRKYISKGWSSGWGGRSKTTEILYDSSGKQIRKTIKRNE